MSNDPNDRFMISDLSSKLSSYINGGYADQTSQTRDPAEIGDVFTFEIKPDETGRKLPGDELFTDLDQALVSRADGSEEAVRMQKPAGGQRQRAEGAQSQQLLSEQQRQLKIQEEQQRLLRLRREKALVRSLAEGLYSFNLDQPFTSVRSGHSARYVKLPPSVRSMPSEEALRRALAKVAKADMTSQAAVSHEAQTSSASYETPVTEEYNKAPQPAVSYEAPVTEEYNKAPQPAASYEAPVTEEYYKAPQPAVSYEAPVTEEYNKAPQPAASYEAPVTEEYYKAPQAAAPHEVQTAEIFFEAPPTETTQSSFEEPDYFSQPSGESRDAKSPDPSYRYYEYRDYQEDRRGGRIIAVIIALLVALLALAAVFIMIRRYSSNLTNLLSGTQAQGTSETVSKVESKVDSGSQEESRAATDAQSNAATESYTESESNAAAESDATADSNVITDSQISASMAINEEGEIFHSDSQITDADDSGELIPEDPNDISYLSSVNKKAAEDAIAELSEAAPRLYLTTYGIKINAGDSFNALAFVERVEDDADDKDRLYRDISVNGLSEFDAKVPGTYELTYFLYDSAGNRSNRAKLTVIVE